MGARLRSLSRAERDAAGATIARAVAALGAYARASRVAAYVALDDEAPTRAILERVLASGRVLLLPRIAEGGLEFAAAGGLAALRRSSLGVLEPDRSCPAFALAAPDLVLVPGIAFDRRGGRLGRGAGHYDRALAQLERGVVAIGVGFSFQLVDAVPMAPLDRRVAGVVTENGLLVAPTDRDPQRDPG